MIKEKDVHVFANFTVANLEKENYCDNINGVFPLDTEENILKSAVAIATEDTKKVYNSNELLYMFSRLITAAQNMSEDTYSKLRNILNPKGVRPVDKVYTQEEMLAEAEKIATSKAAELVADENSKKANEELKTQLTALEAEKATKEAEAIAAKAELETLKADRAAEILKAEQEKKANDRFKLLADDSIVIDKTKEDCLAFLKAQTDEEFNKMKAIFVEIAESAKKTTEELEKEKKLKKDEKAKASLVEDSEVLPNAVDTTDASAVAPLDEVFASIFGKK